MIVRKRSFGRSDDEGPSGSSSSAISISMSGQQREAYFKNLSLQTGEKITAFRNSIQILEAQKESAQKSLNSTLDEKARYEPILQLCLAKTGGNCADLQKEAEGWREQISKIKAILEVINQM